MRFIPSPNKLTWEKDFANKTFDKLTPVSMAGKDRLGQTLVNCICKCGKTIVARGTDLKNCKRGSCGCAKKSGFRRAYNLSTSITSIAKVSIEPYIIPDMLLYKNLPMKPPGRN
jgi:hypothetical protein